MIDKIIFKYLDNKNYIILKTKTDTYFVENEDDQYCQIKLRNDGVCIIYWEIINEISDFFSLEESDSEQVIGRWVENTLQTVVTSTFSSSRTLYSMVENTLQT
jgi:hypothetical protein